MKHILGATVLALALGAQSSPQTLKKNSVPMIRSVVAEARSRCPECDVYVGEGETPNSKGELVPATFVLVHDGGDKLRAHRVETPEGPVIVVYFPDRVVDVKLQKFAKKLGR
jgi:hypothetical protein